MQTGAEHIVMSEVFQAQDVGAHDFLVQAGRLVESTLSYGENSSDWYRDQWGVRK